MLLDLFMMIYQGICVPIYGIPKVTRRDYIRLDRHHLVYLNWIEKLNCEYRGYANGVIACAGEVAAPTEQYWCPIKHPLRMKSLHSRYRLFFEYGDAEHYRAQIESLRRSFEDIKEHAGGGVPGIAIGSRHLTKSAFPAPSLLFQEVEEADFANDPFLPT